MDTNQVQKKAEESQRATPLPVLTGKPKQDDSIQVQRLIKRNVLRDLAVLVGGYCLYTTVIVSSVLIFFYDSAYSRMWPVVSLALTSVLALILYTLLGHWGSETKTFRLWRIICDAGIVIVIPLGLSILYWHFDYVKTVFVLGNVIGVAGASGLVWRFGKE